jgi:hypothetical protein
MRALGWVVAVLALATATAGAGRSKYDWDALGAEFCRMTLAGNLQGIRPLITESLAQAIEAAGANPDLLPPRVLFQTYTNEVPVCEARTRNAALIEVRRSKPGGAPPAWTEYLVIVPEADGTTRIDDVLFATRRSDTLRARLAYFAATR